MVDKNALSKEAAGALGVPASWVRGLVEFESHWDPQAVNPASSARGLMQWTNARARALGFQDSFDLVVRAPTVEKQMALMVKDLTAYAPFPTEQSFYLSVFYPPARYWEATRAFPEAVQKVNPGIRTPYDYVRRVRAAIDGIGKIFPLVVVAVIGAVALLIRAR